MTAPYRRLGLMIAINSVIMFVLTYALIDTTDHFYANVNRVYMAVIMVSGMLVPMLLLMWSMYPNRAVNGVLLVGSAAVFAVTFYLARAQVPIGNEQFLVSMIPHHSSAILMCERSALTDPEIVELCAKIVKAQKEEIAQMKAILRRY